MEPHISRLRHIIVTLIISVTAHIAAYGTEIRLPQIAFFAGSGVEQVVEDTGGTFSVEIGIQSGFTEESFRSSVNSTLSNANWYWISMAEFTMTATQTGVATFSVSAWNEYTDFTFTLLNSTVSSSVPVRQLAHTDYWIENAGTRGIYHEKAETLVLNSSIAGVSYTVMCDGAAVSAVTGTGGPMSIPVTGAGTFTVQCPSGRVRGSMTLELFNFLTENLISTPVNPASLPSGSMNTTMLCTCSSDVQRTQLEEMLQAYNSGMVQYWDTALRLEVSGWYGGSFQLSISCGPNTSSATRTFDTRIITSGGTFIFTQAGGGTPGIFTVTAESDIGGNVGKVHLSGSEPGVEYVLLTPEEYPMASLEGTGADLTFSNVPGAVYNVRAYCGAVSQNMNGQVTVVTRPAGTLSKTTTADEDGRTVTLFANDRGKTVLERRNVSGNLTADTYYVRDARDSIAWVIPPACVSALGASQSLTAGEDMARKYCHVYVHDAQGNILRHDSPGAGTTEYTYDPAGRVTSMQDGAMREVGTRRIWTYDALGRETAIKETASSGTETVLEETFYDTYPDNAASFLAQSGYASSFDSRTKGMITCKRLSVEGRTDFRTSTFYYDGKGNLIQTVENDALGIRRISTAYSFTGKPVKEKETFIPAGSSSGDTVERTWTHDIRDRISEETVCVNSGQTVSIVYVYDALGRPAGSTVSTSGATVSSSVALDLQGRERYRTVTSDGVSLFGSDRAYITKRI